MTRTGPTVGFAEGFTSESLGVVGFSSSGSNDVDCNSGFKETLMPVLCVGVVFSSGVSGVGSGSGFFGVGAGVGSLGSVGVGVVGAGVVGSGVVGSGVVDTGVVSTFTVDGGACIIELKW